MRDHTYQNTDNNNFLTIDQQYADDIGWVSTGQHIIEHIEKAVPDILKQRNLKVNPEKKKNTKYPEIATINGKSVNMLEVFWVQMKI